jgi:hypothetical protein
MFPSPWPGPCNWQSNYYASEDILAAVAAVSFSPEPTATAREAADTGNATVAVGSGLNEDASR